MHHSLAEVGVGYIGFLQIYVKQKPNTVAKEHGVIYQNLGVVGDKATITYHLIVFHTQVTEREGIL